MLPNGENGGEGSDHLPSANLIKPCSRRREEAHPVSALSIAAFARNIPNPKFHPNELTLTKAIPASSCHLSAISHLLSAICYLLSAICYLPQIYKKFT